MNLRLFKNRLRRLWRELAKFASVGAIAFVINFGFFNLFHVVMGLGPLTANGIATVLAASFAYFANRFWTFRHTENTGMGREYALFFALNGIGLLITQLFLGFATYVLKLTGTIPSNAALVIGTGVATVFRYYAYKRWVFRPVKTVVPALAPDPAPAAAAVPAAPVAGAQAPRPVTPRPVVAPPVTVPLPRGQQVAPYPAGARYQHVLPYQEAAGYQPATRDQSVTNNSGVSSVSA